MISTRNRITFKGKRQGCNLQEVRVEVKAISILPAITFLCDMSLKNVKDTSVNIKKNVSFFSRVKHN